MLSVIIWLLYLLRGWIITFIKVTGLLRQARHLANFRSAETATAAAARCTAALLYLLIRLFDFLIYETKIKFTKSQNHSRSKDIVFLKRVKKIILKSKYVWYDIFARRMGGRRDVSGNLKCIHNMIYGW